MTKADIIKKVANTTGLDRIVVLNVVETLMEEIKDSLGNGESVYFRGFGSFTRKTRKAKPARNISRNTTVMVPEHDIPYFKPSPALFEIVLNNK